MNMSWAERLLMVPYVEGGRDLRGADCWGLVMLAYRLGRGVELPGHPNLSASDMLAVARTLKAGETKAADGLGSWRPVAFGDEREFDLAIMTSPVATEGRMRSLQAHCGIVVKPAFVMHTDEIRGRPVNERFRPDMLFPDSPLISRVKAIYRHEALA